MTAFGGVLRAEVVADAGTLSADVAVRDVDLGDAVARFAPALADAVDGTATGSATFTVPAGDGRVALESITGSGELTVIDGRVRGVNLADRVLGDIGGVSLLPRLLSATTRARYQDVFGTVDTTFTTARLPFSVAEQRLAIDGCSSRVGDVRGRRRGLDRARRPGAPARSRGALSR